MKSENNKIIFDDELIGNIVQEVIKEQTISPRLDDDILINYIKEGMYDINDSVGCMIDYNEDLEAKALLKNYVLYANYKRLAEFKELYMSDYVALQLKYNRDTSV